VASIRRFTRYFRFYEKKRGDRRTGSPVLGDVGLTLFFAAVFLTGWCFVGAVAIVLLRPEWRVNRRFVENTCLLAAKREGTRVANGLVTYRPEFVYRHVVDGKEYLGRSYDITGAYTADRAMVQATLARFEVGKSYPCWYDPQDPNVVVLRRGYTSYIWLMALLPFGCISIGAAGLVWRLSNWGASVERRAAVARRAAAIAPVDGQRPGDAFPSVPPADNLSDSPGTVLTYRLPQAGPGRWALVAMCIAGVVWNVMVTACITHTAFTIQQGQMDWLLAGLSVVFAIAGFALLKACAKGLAHVVEVGRTVVEINQHPLHPGEQCRVHISQHGRLRFHTLRLLLVCTEKVTYSQGTNTRTETRRVYEQVVVEAANVVLRRGDAWEAERDLTIPRDAMHSFRSAHNEIQWQLVVEGTPEGCPVFHRTFPIVVCPLSVSTPA
jgi:hypothetical protein